MLIVSRRHLYNEYNIRLIKSESSVCSPDRFLCSTDYLNIYPARDQVRPTPDGLEVVTCAYNAFEKNLLKVRRMYRSKLPADTTKRVPLDSDCRRSADTLLYIEEPLRLDEPLTSRKISSS